MSELNVIQQQSGICRRLRTKNAFGSYIGHATFWEDGDSSTAVYWCLDTMGAAGPDDHFAHPHECKSGRDCFQPRD